MTLSNMRHILETLYLLMQTVTALAFTQQSGCSLLSGSDDTTVSTWVMMDVLDASLSQQAMQQQPPIPLYSWYSICVTPSTCFNSCLVSAALHTASYSGMLQATKVLNSACCSLMHVYCFRDICHYTRGHVVWRTIIRVNVRQHYMLSYIICQACEDLLRFSAPILTPGQAMLPAPAIL